MNTQQLSLINLKTFILTAFITLVSFSASFAGWDEGVAAFKGKNFKLAAKEFKAASVQNPDTWGNHYMLGLSLYYMGQASAGESLRKAYDLNPNDVSVRQGLKWFLGNKGTQRKAAAEYLYGTTALKLGLKHDGRKAFEKALKLDPDNIKMKKAISGTPGF